jgi:hypothetical protein
MTNNFSLPRLTLTTPAAYLIRVRGQTDKNWAENFSDFSVEVSTHPGQTAETILRGRVRDQAALLGMLHCLYYYGTTLVSVECVGESFADPVTHA